MILHTAAGSEMSMGNIESAWYNHAPLVIVACIQTRCVMTVKINVHDALLAALMLTGTIENDEESERSMAASGNAGLPAWRIVAARKSPSAVRRRDECGSRRESRTRCDLRRSFRCRRGKAFHGRSRFARITERRLAGAKLAVTHPDPALDNPGDRRTAAGVSTRRQSSDIGYLDNAARAHKRSR